MKQQQISNGKFQGNFKQAKKDIWKNSFMKQQITNGKFQGSLVKQAKKDIMLSDKAD